MAAAKKIIIPKTLGACADRLYKIKDEASVLAKKAAELDAERKAIQEHVINTLPKSNATGVSGKLANVKVRTVDVPQVKDWDKFYAYIKKNNSFHLMQKRLSEGAVGEILDSGKKIPGVEPFPVVKISLNKV